MFEKEKFTVELTDPMLYDRLRTLSAEYSVSKEQLVNVAAKRLLGKTKSCRRIFHYGIVTGIFLLNSITVFNIIQSYRH